MKNIKKLLVVFLAVLMLGSVAVSCVDAGPTTPTDGTTTAEDNNNTTDPIAVVTTDPTVDENGFLLDDIDQYELNYNNKQVSVLNWKAEKPEFYIEATDGTKVNDAIWERNNAIETRLGVELNFTEEKGDYDNLQVFLQKVESARGDWDIIATYSRTAASIALRGLYKNINTIEDSYLNFEKPWWPNTLIEEVTIGNGLYFVSGDASTNALHFMYTIFFNKDMKEAYTDITDDLYDLVRNNNWTISKLIKLASNRYENTNTDNPGGANFSNSDLDDTYGFCTIHYGVDAFYYGADLNVFDHDDTGFMHISEDYTSDKIYSFIEKLKPFLTGPDCVTFMGSGDYRRPFVENRALFCQERAYLAVNKLGNATFKYGILPTPKWDAAQENYRTILGNPFTLYGIAVDCDAPTDMTAVLEVWGSEGYRKTTPALFEETMKARYADAPDDSDMWNIIRSSVCFDLGRLFHKNDIGYNLSEEPTKVACGAGNWKSLSNIIIGTSGPKLNSIIEEFKKYQANGN